MNIALIFAGGTGQRMNTKTRPKQFLEVHGKPILVYTLEQFQNHPEIDKIVLVSLRDWIPYCRNLINRYALDKVEAVIPGGSSGQESIRLGAEKAAELFSPEDVVLVHDGVRPLIDEDTITRCIACTEEHGSAITVVPAIETIAMEDETHCISNIIDRHSCVMARAPQCFRLGEFVAAHRRAVEEGKECFIDSASIMRHYGHELYTVQGTPDNIKITTPGDFYIFRAMLDARESTLAFGNA